MMKRQDRDISTDKAYLTKEMYPDETNLSIRIRTHELYTQPDIDFTSWILDKINWEGNEVVLDVGCGAGIYTEPVLNRVTSPGFLVSADLSIGMLEDFQNTYKEIAINPLNADILNLPMAVNTYGVILANHMLYHVPDIPAALKELKRCLRPGGHLIAATNSTSSMNRFIDEVNEAISVLGYDLVLPYSQTRLNFSLEDGNDIVKDVFEQVEMFDLESMLVFPDADPVIAYINSFISFYEDKLIDGLSWDTIINQAKSQVDQKIKVDNEYVVPKKTGVFIAQKQP